MLRGRVLRIDLNGSVNSFEEKDQMKEFMPVRELLIYYDSHGLILVRAHEKRSTRKQPYESSLKAPLCVEHIITLSIYSINQPISIILQTFWQHII